MNQDNNTSFLDPKMILVIVFCFGLLILWQGYMRSKYPNYYEQERQNQVIETNQDEISDTPTLDQSSNDTSPNIENLNDVKSLEIKETLISFKSENLSFDISNIGFGLRNILINKYKDKKGDVILFPSNLGVSFLATQVIGDSRPLVFAIQKEDTENMPIGDVKFLGQAEFKGIKIKKTLIVYSKKYLISSTIEFAGDLSEIQGIETVFNESVQIEENNIPLIPIYDTNSYYAVYGTDSKRGYFTDTSINDQFNQVGLLSLDTHYFARTIIDDSKIFPEVQMNYDADLKKASAQMSYVFPENIRSFVIKQDIFIGA